MKEYMCRCFKYHFKNESVHTKSENVKMPLFLGKFTKLFPCNFTSILISKITNFKFVILQSI